MLSRVVFLLLLALGAMSLPLFRRQIGNLECNINRFDIETAVIEANSTISSLGEKLASDPASLQNIALAASAINSTEDGIGKILLAVFTGQLAADADRQQVADGLNNATSALGNINSTDPTVTQLLDQAQGQIVAARQAGDRVVASCK